MGDKPGLSKKKSQGGKEKDNIKSRGEAAEKEMTRGGKTTAQNSVRGTRNRTRLPERSGRGRK